MTLMAAPPKSDRIKGKVDRVKLYSETQMDKLARRRRKGEAVGSN